MFHQLHGERTPFHEQYLAPVGPAQILRRMLANLRHVYVQRRDTASLLWVLELNAQFRDSGQDEHRDLGAVLSAHGSFDRAAAAYERAATFARAAGADPNGDLTTAAVLRARLN